MKRPRPFASARPIALVLLAYIFLLPLAFMVVGSLRTPGLAPASGLEWFPDPLRPANYSFLFEFAPITTYLRNSLLVVAVAVPITVVVASLAGFAIATAAPRTRRILIVVSVAALIIPAGAIWVPRFVLFKWVGLTGSLASLMAPALMATSPFFVLLFAVVYTRIPRSLFESAAVEGLSPLATWRQIAWPLGRPAAAAVAVLAFVFHWSNFIDALLYLSDADTYTVSLGLRSLQTLDPTNHPLLLAAAVVVTAPPVVAFLLAQRSLFVRTLEV